MNAIARGGCGADLACVVEGLAELVLAFIGVALIAGIVAFLIVTYLRETQR